MTSPAKAANSDGSPDVTNPQVGDTERSSDRAISPRYTPAEVAARYGLTQHYVERAARRNQWPHLRIGRRVRFTDEHLAQIDALHEVPVARDMAAAQSWGRKTRGGAA